MKLVIFLLLAGSVQATTWPAADCTSTQVNAAISSASVGDTVTVPACAAGLNISWGASAVVVNKGINIIGQTVCTGSGDPNGGTSGVVSCTDNTNIFLTGEAAFQPNGTTSNPISVSGFTFIGTTVTSLQGLVVPANLAAHNVGFRIHHNHFKMTVPNSRTLEAYGAGLIDHNFFEDAVTSGLAADPLDFIGSSNDHGYAGWNDTTNMGTTEAVYVEANYYAITGAASINTEGFFDAYEGAKVVIRFNTIGGEIGGTHGTDSGFFRSVVYFECYGNKATNITGSFGTFNSRGGTVMAFINNFLGSAALNFIPLQTFRFGAQNPFSSNWGTAGPGLDWLTLSATPTNQNSNVVSTNSADFVASHTYAANAVVGPVTSNASNANFQLTNGPKTCGVYPGSWNSTYNATTTDSAGCVWLNVGGQISGGVAKWCALNPDTTCTADTICSALSVGDTCSRFLDTNGGNYPYRDQVGRVHNQVLAPAYEWSNVGNFTPPLFNVSGSNLTIILANRDFYNFTASFTGASGVGAGTLAARPANCTAGVAYWATDQGNWNQSGNGSGQGVLSQCTVTGTPGTWNNTYYTPLTYPHPLAQVSLPNVVGSGVQVIMTGPPL